MNDQTQKTESIKIAPVSISKTTEVSSAESGSDNKKYWELLFSLYLRGASIDEDVSVESR
jgi:hypothetical protein